MKRNNMLPSRHPFERAGFAALSALKREEWRELFMRLDQAQAQFLAHEQSFRSPEYIWPRDPLHTWSRVWEYPYVYYHLEKLRREIPEERLLTVADFGSGVTFFPFAVARLGYDVTCIDIDPVCAHDIPAAANVIDGTPGSVGVKLLDNNRIPLPNNSQDVVYCISVLEHIPDFGQTISEIVRILNPGGKFVLTVDIGLRGDYMLSAERFDGLMRCLRQLFFWELPEASVHPMGFLTSENSIFPMKPGRRATLLKWLENLILRNTFNAQGQGTPWLTVYATVVTKRGSD
jgi:SAM-dependent methyltransferase